jgi:hypothetical protein
MSKTEKTSPAPSAASKPDAARRALLRGAIKGAALAPAIVTLKSGSAWAAAGSVPCYQKTYTVQAVGGSDNLNVFLNDPITGQPTSTQITQGQVSATCWSSGGNLADITRVRPR